MPVVIAGGWLILNGGGKMITRIELRSDIAFLQAGLSLSCEHARQLDEEKVHQKLDYAVDILGEAFQILESSAIEQGESAKFFKNGQEV